MIRRRPIAALAGVVMLLVTWVALTLVTGSSLHLVSPQPTYLTGRLVDLLSG